MGQFDGDAADEQADEGAAQAGDSSNVVARKFFKARRRVPTNNGL